MVGWYHSHPGYGCWLSGIDVSTQSIQQQYQEPFLAIVVDPHRTIAAGKVEIGAFRTYPEVHSSHSVWFHDLCFGHLGELHGFSYPLRVPCLAALLV